MCEANADALRARKNSVVPEGQGAGIFWLVLRTGAVGDTDMGLSAGRNLFEVRYLVFLLRRLANDRSRCVVTISAAAALHKDFLE